MHILSDRTRLAIKWAFIFILLGAFTLFTLAGSTYSLKRAVATTIEKEGFALGTYNRLFVLLSSNSSRFDVFGKKILCEVGTVGRDILESKYDTEVSSIEVKGQHFDLLQIEAGEYTDGLISDIQEASNVAPNCKPLDSRNFFFVIFTPHVS